MKSKEDRKAWWAALPQEEKDAYIAKKERSRKSNKRGKDETWTNEAGTFIKVWTSDDSYYVKRVETAEEKQVAFDLKAVSEQKRAEKSKKKAIKKHNKAKKMRFSSAERAQAALDKNARRLGVYN